MISIELAGTLTIVALVALGIFIYPWLFTKRGGAWIVGLTTVGLAAAYTYFDVGRSSLPVALALGVLWALLPLAAGLVTLRANRALKEP